MSDLYTLGHSNRSLAQFFEILIAHDIKHIVDVRAMPHSRLFPWFNKITLAKSLALHHIEYRHLSTLGGRRPALRHSENSGWENKSFKGFADYMQTEGFFNGIQELKLLYKQAKTAILCAEALPWRCHRHLIADAMTIRKIKVYHLMDKHHTRPHQLTTFAVVDRNKRPIKIFYPSPNFELKI